MFLLSVSAGTSINHQLKTTTEKNAFDMLQLNEDILTSLGSPINQLISEGHRGVEHELLGVCVTNGSPFPRLARVSPPLPSYSLIYMTSAFYFGLLFCSALLFVWDFLRVSCCCVPPQVAVCRPTFLFLSPPNSKCLHLLMASIRFDLQLGSTHSSLSTIFFVVLACGQK